jgi:hypothetical protein
VFTISPTTFVSDFLLRTVVCCVMVAVV